MHTFVIAEIGVNHNGRLDLALELADQAAQAGADAAKFQTFTADALVAPGTATVAYQRDTSGQDDQSELLRALELGHDDHARIVEHCKKLSIEFMSTAFDLGSLDMLVDLGIRRIKVPSGEVTNEPYLRAVAAKRLPIILSTGMADMAEVREAMRVIADEEARRGLGSAGLVVLHCTTAYPAKIEDVNLLAMRSMATELGVEIGYSDHTSGIVVAPAAVAMGASVIEKHLTLDRKMEGPDHSASLEPDQFAEMVATIRAIETSLGDGIKAPRPAEMEARSLVRRGLKAARDLAAGATLAETDIAILRPASGLPPSLSTSIVGKRLATALKAGEPIEERHLSA